MSCKAPTPPPGRADRQAVMIDTRSWFQRWWQRKTIQAHPVGGLAVVTVTVWFSVLERILILFGRTVEVKVRTHPEDSPELQSAIFKVCKRLESSAITRPRRWGW